MVAHELNVPATHIRSVPQKQIAARYDLVQLLGHGSFGSTFIVQDKEDLRQYVLKRVTCKNQEDVYAAMREVRTRSRLARHTSRACCSPSSSLMFRACWVLGYRCRVAAQNMLLTRLIRC